MAFDECTPDDAPLEYARQALGRTHAWAGRSLAAHQKNTAHHGYPQFLFGIIQGGPHKTLREESAKFIASLDFDGIAIGGESIGYNMEATKDILDWVSPLIPADKPHNTMGLGLSPADLLVAVAHGADMFDCVAPTRLARHGMLFIQDKKNKHRLNIKNAEFKTDTRPIDETCSCSTCKNYTRQYLHHLFNAEEVTALRLSSIHNLHFMLALMRAARSAILQNSFAEFAAPWL
jgi:tRNA-guanine transglycosylase